MMVICNYRGYSGRNRAFRVCIPGRGHRTPCGIRIGAVLGSVVTDEGLSALFVSDATSETHQLLHGAVTEVRKMLRCSYGQKRSELTCPVAATFALMTSITSLPVVGWDQCGVK